MRLNINLLFESERRDPKLMVLRTFMVTTALVIVAAIVLYGLQVFVAMKEAQNRLQRAEQQWSSLSKDSKRALNLRAQCDTLEAVTADLAAFSNAQIKASHRLIAMAHVVPPEVQLVELRLENRRRYNEQIPAREFAFRFTGRTAADDGEARVQMLLQGIQSIAAPYDFGEVEPRGVRVDPKTQENTFEIMAILPARSYR